MNFRTLTAGNFAGYDAAVVDLPEAGIVTLVGPNGAGKSSVVEVASVAVWGRTLRGSTPWRPGVDGYVSAAAVLPDDLDLYVTLSAEASGRSRIAWSLHQRGLRIASADDYDTMTKARAALERHVGPWDVWRRTHVFSSQDAAHFSAATDAERKRFLESVLGLGRVDGACDRCRSELRAADAAEGSAERVLAAAVAALGSAEREAAGARRRLEEAAGDAGDPPPDPGGDPSALLAEARGLDSLRAAAEGDAAAARRREQSALSGAAGKGADLRALQIRLALLSGRAECPTCQQVVPPDAVRLVEAAAAAEHARMLRLEADARAATAAARSDAAELEEEVRGLRSRAQDLRIRASAAEAARSARDGWSARRGAARRRAEADVASAEAALTSAASDHAAAEAALVSARGRVAVLTGASDALGLRGVRAHVLARSLSGLETAASVWLTCLSYDMMSLKLSPYTAKKDGGLSDSISVRVGPKGSALREYDSLSGGERRRVDVALLLALSEVAASARAEPPGTLWVDEVFDALDADGIGAVTEALSGLAASRAVVVISHRPELVDALPAALRLRADSGRILPA